MIVNSDYAKIASWATRDMEVLWPDRIGYSFFQDYCQIINNSLSVYVFEFRDGTIEFRAKGSEFPAFRRRADTYLSFFRCLSKKNSLPEPATLIVDVEDQCGEHSVVPVMSFQRVKGSRNPLLPDVEALDHDYFSSRDWGLPDDKSFEEKLDSAIFVGSTTGISLLTENDVIKGLLPRLKAARFFRDKPKVEFLLSSIVQCANGSVEQMLRDEGFGQGYIPFSAQLTNKFLISMDGNGAALSRVHVAIASNSALLKYESPNEAFYFSRLIPGEHYIPIETNIDVLDVVDGDPGRYAPVASAGRDFAEAYLTRGAFEAYAASLIRAYGVIIPMHNPKTTASRMSLADGTVLGRTIFGISSGQQYTSFLAELCQRRRAKTYLEIGVHAGTNLSAISVPRAIGVDPYFVISFDPTAGKKEVVLYRMDSDDYFLEYNPQEIDVSFLDGLHKFDYLLRDFINTERCSKDDGVITMHDCLPFDVSMITREDNKGAWTGDVYKVVMILEKYRPDLEIFLADCHPTGLVCITNLDPSSKLLKDKYDEIVDEFIAIPNDEKGLLDYYEGRVIHSAEFVKQALDRN